MRQKRPYFDFYMRKEESDFVSSTVKGFFFSSSKFLEKNKIAVIMSNAEFNSTHREQPTCLRSWAGPVGMADGISAAIFFNLLPISVSVN